MAAIRSEVGALAAIGDEASPGTVSACMELGKARLSSLVVFSTFVGFVLASPAPLEWVAMVCTLVGTFASALGANAFNQWWEADRDAIMHRTRRRPLPAGHMTRGAALVFALIMSITGPAILLALVNPLSAVLAASTIIIYVLVYTPMKIRTPLNTIVGAVVGAIPPMIGWAAASGGLHVGAFVLAAILFVWQIPHFLSLAWMYREDYARGGYRMLPNVDLTGEHTFWIILLYTGVLIPLTLGATLIGMTGYWFAFGALVLTSGFLWACVRLSLDRGDAAAKRVFLASVMYLPLVLGLMLVDRGPNRPMRIDGAVIVVASAGGAVSHAGISH